MENCVKPGFSMFLVVQGVHVEAKLGYVEAMLKHLESMLGHLGPRLKLN